MARILIAGCGYVGNALGRCLAAEGHEVFGLRRNTAQLATGIRPFRAALDDPGTLGNLPENLDYVYCTCGADGFSEAAYRTAYVTGPGNLLAALERQGQGPKRVVFTSSTGVYHQNDGETVDEDSATEPKHFSGRLVLEGEALFEAAPFPATVVRLSGIYGPGRTRTIESVRDGSARLVSGRTAILNHIHRDDCAGILEKIMTLKAPADRYLGVDDAPTDKNEILRWLADQLQVPEPPVEQVSPEAPPQRGGHRYYSNARIKAAGYRFLFPTFREGYGSLL